MVSMIAMVLMGGGFVVLMIFTIILGIIRAIILRTKPGKIEQKCKDTKFIEVKKKYRYLLIRVATNEILGGGDDYIEVCRKKRDLGNGIMIKDTQYVKKGIII